MTDDEIKKFIHQCKVYARHIGFYNDDEDFSQVAVISYINGRKASVSQLFIDYLRTTYGDKGTLCYRTKQSERLYPKPLNQGIFNMMDRATANDYFKHNYYVDRKRIVDLDQGFTDYLSKKELSYLDQCVLGNNSIEISKILNISESRASQLKKSIIKKIRDYLDFKDGKIRQIKHRRRRFNF